jgi:hypothetical protein
MSRVGFEPTIPVFKRANTVHTLDGAATVIGYTNTAVLNYLWKYVKTLLACFPFLKNWALVFWDHHSVTNHFPCELSWFEEVACILHFWRNGFAKWWSL